MLFPATISSLSHVSFQHWSLPALGDPFRDPKIFSYSAYPMTDPFTVLLKKWCSMDPIKINPLWLLALIYQHQPDPSWVWMPMGDYNAPFRDMAGVTLLRSWRPLLTMGSQPSAWLQWRGGEILAVFGWKPWTGHVTHVLCYFMLF